MPGHGVQQGQATGLDPKIQIVGKIYRCCEIFILFYFLTSYEISMVGLGSQTEIEETMQNMG